jgi:hypothetical protein
MLGGPALVRCHVIEIANVEAVRCLTQGEANPMATPPFVNLFDGRVLFRIGGPLDSLRWMLSPRDERENAETEIVALKSRGEIGIRGVAPWPIRVALAGRPL